MSVQTQIDRISGNVTAALSAIAEKGVAVPDGSTSDALAELIASIEAGGGLPEGITAITTGTYTPANNSSKVKITHGLGITPNFIFIGKISGDAITSAYAYITSCSYFNGGYFTAHMSGARYSGTASATITDSDVSITASKAVYTDTNTNSTSTKTAYFYSTHTFIWIAGVLA